MEETTLPEEENKKIDDKLQEKLMALRGFTTDSHFYFTPDVIKNNMDRNDWPIFKLKGRDGIAIAKTEDDSGYYKAKTDQMFMTTGTSRLDMLRNCILGWNDKFLDKKGNPIPFIKTGARLDDKSLKLISHEMQLELQEAIMKHSQLTSEEVEGLEF